MIGALFLLLICAGIYLLLRSRYETLSIGRYIGYSVAVIIVGVITLSSAVVFGRNLRNLRGTGIGRPVGAVFNAVIPNLADRVGDVQIIELNADDLDPQIQEALLDAVRRRTRRREISTEDVLKELEVIPEPQEGVCGVCYDNLVGDLLACPECHKPAHKSCLKEWIESGQNVCIYCRHDLITV